MKALLPAILLAALIMGPALTSSAEEGGGAKTSGNVAPGSPEKGGEAVERTPAAEPPGSALAVEYAEGRLSVDVRDQAFGDVVTAISNAAGFEVELSNDVFRKRLTTRFRNTELKRGLQRLLSLMEQKNYFIDYNPDGSIKKLKIYGDISTGMRTIRGVPAPSRPVPASPPPVLPRRALTRPGPPRPAPQPAETVKPAQEEKVVDEQFIIDVTGAGEEAQPAEHAEEEPIPEGEMPPESSLINAPYLPPGGPPAEIP